MSSDAVERKFAQIWKKFAKRHAGHRFLGQDPIYALSEPFIDGIVGTMPDFFTKSDEEFERDLARTISFCFFRQRPHGTPGPASGWDEAAPQQRWKRSDEKIKKMLATEFGEIGAEEGKIRESFAAGTRRRQVVEAAQSAYIGWLVSNAQFWQALSDLRAKWQDTVFDLGRFPRYPMWPNRDLGLNVKLPDGFEEDFLLFYSDWNLIQLSTWDWPQPMEPDLTGGMIEDVTSETGVRLFLPWYLLRSGRLNIQDLLGHTKATNAPSHLRGWVMKSGKKDGPGEVRYARARWVYRQVFLCLLRRYPAECDGRLHVIDEVVADLHGGRPGVESFRRTRMNLQGALKKAACSPRVDPSS
jgi:hypothetical protein